MSPILTVPDPATQFIVEVDASNEGIGAVLSQRAKKVKKIRPCTYLSRKLLIAERNYDVGNKELLAVKTALGVSSLQGADTLSLFKSRLNTFLFNKAYS